MKGASLVAQTVKNLPAIWEAWVRSLGWEDPLEEGMATHSSILAQRIPMDRGAWWATVHGVIVGYNEWLSTAQQSQWNVNEVIYFTSLLRLLRSWQSFFYSFFFFNWRITLYRIVLVSAKHQHKSAIGIHLSPPSWISLPPPSPSHPTRLLQIPGLSSLSHTANSHWLSILHMVIFLLFWSGCFQSTGKGKCHKTEELWIPESSQSKRSQTIKKKNFCTEYFREK